jgi:hypothetical protein
MKVPLRILGLSFGYAGVSPNCSSTHLIDYVVGANLNRVVSPLKAQRG